MRQHSLRPCACWSGPSSPAIVSTRGLTPCYQSPHTANGDYLAFAEQVFGFWWGAYVSDDGDMVDHITRDGKKISYGFTYNQGMMMRAAIALYHATGNATYATRASLLGRFMLSRQVGKCLRCWSPVTGASLTRSKAFWHGTP